MKKFLIISILFFSCATPQLKPIGNDAVYQPPDGWVVDTSGVDDPFNDKPFDAATKKEFVVYMSGMNKISIMCACFDKPFDYEAAYQSAKNNVMRKDAIQNFPSKRNPEISKLDNVITGEFGLSVKTDPFYMSTMAYGVSYGSDIHSCLLSIVYVGLSPESAEKAKSGLYAYDNTVKSVRLK